MGPLALHATDGLPQRVAKPMLFGRNARVSSRGICGGLLPNLEDILWMAVCDVSDHMWLHMYYSSIAIIYSLPVVLF